MGLNAEGRLCFLKREALIFGGCRFIYLDSRPGAIFNVVLAFLTEDTLSKNDFDPFEELLDRFRSLNIQIHKKNCQDLSRFFAYTGEYAVFQTFEADIRGALKNKI